MTNSDPIFVLIVGQTQCGDVCVVDGNTKRQWIGYCLCPLSEASESSLYNFPTTSYPHLSLQQSLINDGIDPTSDNDLTPMLA